MTSISVGKIGKIGEKHLTDSGVGIIMRLNARARLNVTVAAKCNLP
jgi:hypothetical protein